MYMSELLEQLLLLFEDNDSNPIVVLRVGDDKSILATKSFHLKMDYSDDETFLYITNE